MLEGGRLSPVTLFIDDLAPPEHVVSQHDERRSIAVPKSLRISSQLTWSD
jgi:hypothetical protein